MKTIHKLMAIALCGFLATGFEVKAADLADFIAKTSSISNEALEGFIMQIPPMKRIQLAGSLGMRLAEIEQYQRTTGRALTAEQELEKGKIMIVLAVLNNF